MLRASHNLSKDELALAQERGNILDIVGRQQRGKHLFYEVRRPVAMRATRIGR